MARKKHILQLDYDTGELIDEYESIEAAAYDNWLTREMLSKVLNRYNGLFKKKKLRFQVKEIA